MTSDKQENRFILSLDLGFLIISRHAFLSHHADKKEPTLAKNVKGKRESQDCSITLFPFFNYTAYRAIVELISASFFSRGRRQTHYAEQEKCKEQLIHRASTNGFLERYHLTDGENESQGMTAR